MIFLVNAFILIIGFLLDFFLGDPEIIPHPVVLMGRLISFLESKLRTPGESRERERVKGIFLVIIVAAVSTLIPWALILIAGKINRYLEIFLKIFWCWQLLAMGSLKKEADMVYDKVEVGDLPAARNQIARIVGRDTSNLSLIEIIKACVETVAESTSDGIIAPLFYMFIGGIPLGFTYKAINTLDSMVGYRNERYRYFGTFAARLDDVANFIPSRITALLMILVSPICGARAENKLEKYDRYVEGIDSFDRNRAFRIWRRDHGKHLSPNSGNPEAAIAGALGIQLGGDAYYFGERYEKATLGDDLRKVTSEDIKRASDIMYSASTLALLIGSGILFILNLIK